MPDINIIIDELTPCLKDSKTGEFLNTDFSAIKISKAKARSMMKDGWKFDWSKPFQEGFEVFQLNIKDSKAVEGLISLKNEDGFTFIGIVESAPSNFGTNGKYTGVGGHLFAIACQHSFKNGNDGYVAFDAKTDLVDYYKEMFNAKNITEQRMYLDTDAALKLLEIYTLEEGGQ